MKPENQEWLLQAQTLSAGLLYPSESDEPINPFVWEELPNEAWQERLLQPADSQMISDFFAKASEIRNWFGEAEKEEALKFKNLADFIQNNLQNLHIFKEGEIEIEVFVIGQLPSGDWAGIQTLLVQT